MTGKLLPVRVAVRIRPISNREVEDGCLQSLEVTPGEPQVVLSGTQKAFTYDFVFDTQQSQQDLYDTSVKGMLDNLFQGYNVTILAYGQTGSGKTYTMGTSYSREEGMTEHTGVIPRAMGDLFEKIAQLTNAEYSIRVSFLEIYKEQLFDLLAGGPREENVVEIREDGKGIKVAGLTEVAVSSVAETIRCLERGGVCRVTAATAMNQCSSRSHAIFTVVVEQRAADTGQAVTAKLNLVDLAGSERAKKTQATGDRLREGININHGLLSLGNVISALGENKPAKHIPYRNSKLTRMLQESLGGNAHTLMIACTSPADYNLEETVSTLRYADRARKIKNKPIVNRAGDETARLRQQVRELQLQLLQLQGGIAPVAAVAAMSPGGPLRQENLRLKQENARLMQTLQSAITENADTAEKLILGERAQEQMKQRLEELYWEMGRGMAHVAGNGDPAELLRSVQGRVMDLQAEQTAHEEELKKMDVRRHTSTRDDEEVEGGSGDEEELKKEFEQRQLDFNSELVNLNKALALKENLVAEMASNDAKLTRVRERYERAKQELEDKVASLVDEKKRLEAALQGARAGSTGESSQKKKRVLALEQHIKDLQLKIKEQDRIMRMKRAADEKVVKLNSEIQVIKQARVKLIRQIREESEKFRHWRQQKDREVMQLKAQDRKRQCQLVKMERQHNKQETVLRRKMEQAVAANRRLKEVMEVQRAAQSRRQGTGAAAAPSTGAATATATAIELIEQEAELRVTTQLAKRSLEHLLEDRKRINHQIAETELMLQREDASADEMALLARTKRDLTAELEGRSAQISDLQRRLVESDGRAPASAAAAQRWTGLATMAEAKKALSHALDQLVTARTDAATRQTDLEEVQTQLSELSAALQEQERQQRALRAQHELELNQLQLDSEDKVLFLLRHMPPPERCSTPEPAARQEAEADPTQELRERLEFQQREIARLSELHETLVEREAQLAELRSEHQQLSSEVAQLRAGQAQQEKGTREGRGKGAAPAPRANRKFKKPSPLRASLKDIITSSEEEEEDDEDADPTWKKTPLFRRLKQITSRAKRAGEAIPIDSDSENQEPTDESTGGVKRSSDGAVKDESGGAAVPVAANQTFVVEDSKPGDTTYTKSSRTRKSRRLTLVPKEHPQRIRRANSGTGVTSMPVMEE